MARILIVDDDDQFRTMLTAVLVRAGYEVQEATDGGQAIKLYGASPTDLVITDLVMPGKEGLEMIVEFKQLYPEAKLIAISGGGRGGSQDYLTMAKAFGAQRVLAKPFSNREILELISQVLQG
ncbi:MAG: response regulator [Pyrinomonadaceae bacterium]|nr:response regulator [Pyrinomonadaceae bacterium]